MQTPSFRTISGVITDGHEPLRGAVVQLENEETHQVESYLTQTDGHYAFRHIDSHTDFQIWATFRDHRSNLHSISKFDDHLQKTINMRCKTF